ncbi:MAG TPA: M12 family metallopeptidase [Terrimicrobiaceae bacterium]
MPTDANDILDATPSYCCQPQVPEPVLPPEADGERTRLIRLTAYKWANGTRLRYCFFDKDSDGSWQTLSDGTRVFQTWKAPDEAHKDVVRNAFKKWKDLGIGLQFEEVSQRNRAQVRIGFQQGDGSWSYLGRQILSYGANARTMNFGWSLTESRTRGLDTAMHEIGHTLGFPHEHQNPIAGIVWDEEAVYRNLAGPPNRWSREKTHWNILRKIDPDEVQGSSWDSDSIMHYPFKSGLIREPEEFRNGIRPSGGLSERDKEWVRTFYPPMTLADAVPLVLFESRQLVGAAPAEQTFLITPDTTREYEIRTVGTADTVLVLFEENDGNPIQIAADDDSGEEKNAAIKLPLVEGRRYLLQARLNYAPQRGGAAVIIV